ncbi:MAG: hypothetical protein HOH33_02090 [Verrucomicrobia bacterium]|nr:hypothetical protein [Verrucomicrobiota bacterium]
MKQRCEWRGKCRTEGWACAGLILQVALIYFTSVWSKSGNAWSNGSAVELALNIDAYTSDFGRMLLSYPILLKALTYGTLTIEWIAPLLLLGGHRTSLRMTGCWMLISLQSGFLVFMRLGLFPLVSIIALIAFIPLRVSSQKDRSNPPKQSIHSSLEIAAVIFVCLMLIWQVAIIQNQFRANVVLSKTPDPIAWILKTTRMAQSWSMFSPDPPEKDGWFILEYHDTQKGKSVDLLRNGEAMNWEKQSSDRRGFGADRWKEWFNKVHLRGLNWDQTVNYFAREHRKLNPSNEEESFMPIRLWYVEESAQRPHQAPERHLLFESKQSDSTSTR